MFNNFFENSNSWKLKRLKIMQWIKRIYWTFFLIIITYNEWNMHHIFWFFLCHYYCGWTKTLKIYMNIYIIFLYYKEDTYRIFFHNSYKYFLKNFTTYPQYKSSYNLHFDLSKGKLFVLIFEKWYFLWIIEKNLIFCSLFKNYSPEFEFFTKFMATR